MVKTTPTFRAHVLHDSSAGWWWVLYISLWIRLKPPQRAYCARIEALRPRIKYAIQEQQEVSEQALSGCRDGR